MKSNQKIILLFFILFVVFAFFIGYWSLQTLKPSYKKSISIPNLSGQITVSYDQYNIPHISAERENDLYKVRGYLHARDRLWQMTQYQYKLEGLHTQYIHSSLIDIDRFYLTLSFGQYAQKAYEQLSFQDKIWLAAYADGVNHYVRSNIKNLPVEFTINNAQPVEWEPWHSIGVKMLWFWQYQQAFWSKPAFNSLHVLDQPEVTRALTVYDRDHSSLFGLNPPVLSSESYSSLLDAFLYFIKKVKPTRTLLPGSGFAISHQSAPSVAALLHTRDSGLSFSDAPYEMASNLRGNYTSGIYLPGYPEMISGQNQHAAWALFPLAADDGFFYSGKLFNEHPSQPVNWQLDPSIENHLTDEIVLNRHILSMKNGGEYSFVSMKANGNPVVAYSEKHNRYLAFEWPGFSYISSSGEHRNLAYSTSKSDFKEAVSSLYGPPFQLLFTTLKGEAGRLTGGYTYQAEYPLKIYPSAEKVTPVRADLLFPHFISSAGDPVLLKETPEGNFLGQRVFSPYFSPFSRSERYLALWQEKNLHKVEKEVIEKWHNDTYSSFAKALIPNIIHVLEAESYDSRIATVLPYLKNWDFEFSGNQTAATLFELFLQQAAGFLYLNFINEKEMELLFNTPQIPVSVVANLIQNNDEWPASHYLKRDEWILESMKATVDHLIQNYGTNAFEWQWEKAVTGAFSPFFFEEIMEEKRSAHLANRYLFNPGKFSVTGSSHTLHASHMNYNSPLTLSSVTTLKCSVFLLPSPNGFSILHTGQSGNIFSDHFDDQFFLWKKGIKKDRPPYHTMEESDFQYEQYFTP